MSQESIFTSQVHPTYRPTGARPGTYVERRLALHSMLSAEAREALERLLGKPTRFEARALIAEAGDEADLITILHDGYACRTTLLADGRRQIHSLALPGDTLDAEAPLLGVRPDNIEALTRCSVWRLPKARLRSLLNTQPELAEAFAREAAISAQVAREWVVNLGQRSALERVAHLICEIYARLDAVGLVVGRAYIFAMTQKDIADAQGLSVVHVNRVLQELRRQGLIGLDRRRMSVPDMAKLQALSLFDPRYLHLSSIEHRAA